MEQYFDILPKDVISITLLNLDLNSLEEQCKNPKYQSICNDQKFWQI